MFVPYFPEITYGPTTSVNLKKEMEPKEELGWVWVLSKNRDKILRDCLSRLHEDLEKSRRVMKAVQR